MPTADLPSTAIPRFAEDLVPPIVAPPVTYRSMFFPNPGWCDFSGELSTSFKYDNRRLPRFLFWARGNDGTVLFGAGITNWKRRLLLGPEQQTSTMTLNQIFGSLDPALIGSVGGLQSTNTGIWVGTTIGSGYAQAVSQVIPKWNWRRHICFLTAPIQHKFRPSLSMQLELRRVLSPLRLTTR